MCPLLEASPKEDTRANEDLTPPARRERQNQTLDRALKRRRQLPVFPADDRVAIEALHSAWLDAELRGDSSALLHFCTRTPVWLPPNEEPLCGRAAILRWLTDQPHTGVLRIDIDDLVISGSGSFASKLDYIAVRYSSKVAARGAGAEVITGSHGWFRLQRDDAGANGAMIVVVGWTIARSGRSI